MMISTIINMQMMLKSEADRKVDFGTCIKSTLIKAKLNETTHDDRKSDFGVFW